MNTISHKGFTERQDYKVDDMVLAVVNNIPEEYWLGRAVSNRCIADMISIGHFKYNTTWVVGAGYHSRLATAREIIWYKQNKEKINERS